MVVGAIALVVAGLVVAGGTDIIPGNASEIKVQMLDDSVSRSIAYSDFDFKSSDTFGSIDKIDLKVYSTAPVQVEVRTYDYPDTNRLLGSVVKNVATNTEYDWVSFEFDEPVVFDLESGSRYKVAIRSPEQAPIVRLGSNSEACHRIWGWN